MVVERGSVWWAELPDPRGSEPGYRRPVLIVQADAYNRSYLPTVIAVVLTSNLHLMDAPGNVLVPAGASGLPRDSVANVTQTVTLDRDYLVEQAGRLPSTLMKTVGDGLRQVLGL